ncbi:glycosyltransferase [Promicromonospora sp. NPDC050262]|uniref:glycosyltransferase n=1 Tax=Promicromonospora sp. NPDC050262 TaxID=3155036 RepID=UPI0033D810F9
MEARTAAGPRDVQLSIIIPAYNAEATLRSALSSVSELDEHGVDYEVVVIDDCSTDATVEVAERLSSGRPSWRVVRLPNNTGSPSAPRNAGVDAARGEFVYFHDSDDELLAAGVAVALDVAVRNGSDLVRGPLLVRDDMGETYVGNRLADAAEDGDRDQLIERIFAEQSTTPPAIIRRRLLADHQIRWDPDVRMGEDTLFLAEVVLRADSVHYSDAPLYVYDRRLRDARSSTQAYDDAALRNHLHVWTSVQRLLAERGIDYLAGRGRIGVREALVALYTRRSGSIARDTFVRLQDFLRRYDGVLGADTFKPRIQEIYRMARDGAYEAFCDVITPRLLVAGYDLKFIMGALPRLGDDFVTMVDEWEGHDRHDAKRSERLLAWADIVFCDWLLGNATWYARHVRPEQVLVVRGHRFELERNFGFDPVLDRVDRFYSVSVKTLEDFLQVFPIPRSRARLLANWVDVDSYAVADDPERVYRLAIVGAVPERKGMLRALQVLADLRASDERFHLHVYGKAAHEVDWIWKDDAERDYFERCDRFVEQHELAPAITYHGWADMRSELATTGWVLSTSEDESFHLAPAEGFAAGGQGLVLDWPGAEYVYPPRFVFRSVDEMVSYVEKNLDADTYVEGVAEGREFVVENYDLERFADRLTVDLNALLTRRSTR